MSFEIVSNNNSRLLDLFSRKEALKGRELKMGSGLSQENCIDPKKDKSKPLSPRILSLFMSKKKLQEESEELEEFKGLERKKLKELQDISHGIVKIIETESFWERHLLASYDLNFENICANIKTANEWLIKQAEKLENPEDTVLKIKEDREKELQEVKQLQAKISARKQGPEVKVSEQQDFLSYIACAASKIQESFFSMLFAFESEDADKSEKDSFASEEDVFANSPEKRRKFYDLNRLFPEAAPSSEPSQLHNLGLL